MESCSPALPDKNSTLFGFVLFFLVALPLEAADLPPFEQAVQPFVKRYCLDCHGADDPAAKLDLSAESSAESVVRHHQVWEMVVQRLTAKEMPPDKSPQPTDREREVVITWIKARHDAEAEQHAGDPGPVLARRLSHAEYDNAIRDLTGFDLRPTREFPVDPANAAGFDNSGESLTMSPALFKKYLEAARKVAEHLTFQPRGLSFSPYPMISETDRDKFCVQRIVDFYDRHRIDLADYFQAAIELKQRRPPERTLAEIAAERQLSAKYLQTIWTALETPVAVGPLADLQREWNGGSLGGTISERRKTAEEWRETIIARRKALAVKVEKLHLRGQSDGSQPLVLWWNRQQAEQRRRYAGSSGDPALDEARREFCRVFPDAFAITSRGHYADANLGAEVRLLTAGFHLMQGYFRDDAPLCELVLADAEREEIDALWQELNFITLAPIRQYKDFLFFERAEPPRFAGGPDFDFARPEDKSVTTAPMMDRMRDAYIAKAKTLEASDEVLHAIEDYFTRMSAEFRWIEQAQRDAEPIHLAALLKLAERAYRRPLTVEEQAEWRAFYESSRQSGLSHEDAVRDTFATILLSPHFSYRFDLASDDSAIQPLSDIELASRLSFFLWSSLPDEELLSRAADHTLSDPAVLIAQTRRMLRDPKARGLAREFLGNWLGFRRFEDHTGVDRERFPAFTNELRAAMAEEPVRFFIDLLQRDGSVRELWDADHTFVNATLAKHYGMDVTPGPHEWVRVDHASRSGRGGLLPMAVFLTKNSPGLRTSPVQRGYWVVRRMLGEQIPPPPPSVPELPKDEAEFGDLTLAQLLARHRDHAACAGCHQRFDAVGLVFEDYGPIGERRARDLGGKPVNTEAEFPDGVTRSGLTGLREYLRNVRQRDFTDTFHRQLVAFALGRSLILSDKKLLAMLRSQDQSGQGSIGQVIETIVTSPQFRRKRGDSERRD
ncbi:MAG TPA: DUF1592 domain-containing protein [Planctomycetaceae bacterium]|nr:DUF1592 domain-containing protein [Planctomycetaceae bacterium]